MSACVCSVCTLRNCVDFIQVLQLSFSAAFVADFPVGDKHDSMTLLKALSETADWDRDPQHSSSLFTHLHRERTQERTESQREALSSSNLCVSMYFWCSSVLRALCCLPQILLRLNKLLSCAEYEVYELGLNAFRKCTSRKDEAEAKTLISPKNHWKTET